MTICGGYEMICVMLVSFLLRNTANVKRFEHTYTVRRLRLSLENGLGLQNHASRLSVDVSFN